MGICPQFQVWMSYRLPPEELNEQAAVAHVHMQVVVQDIEQIFCKSKYSILYLYLYFIPTK